MPLKTYNYETILEAAFKSALATDQGVVVLIPADYDATPETIPDECIRVRLDVNGLAQERQNADGVYDFFSGEVEIEVRTPRASPGSSGDSGIAQRHDELVCEVRQNLAGDFTTLIAALATEPVHLVRCVPGNTRRESDEKLRMSTMTYQVQFIVDSE